ncbi:MAG: class I SAM-dependent methyltransferase [Patescibacteria group bacterium]
MNKNLQQSYNNWHFKHEQNKIQSPKRVDYEFYEFFIEFLGILKDDLTKEKFILDVGCGDGKFFASFKDLRLKVKKFGIDISDFAIEKAKNNNPDGNFSVAEAEKLPFSDCYFDYVTCWGGG